MIVVQRPTPAVLSVPKRPIPSYDITAFSHKEMFLKLLLNDHCLISERTDEAG
jgi:hypothetical protein